MSGHLIIVEYVCATGPLPILTPLFSNVKMIAVSIANFLHYIYQIPAHRAGLKITLQ